MKTPTETCPNLDTLMESLRTTPLGELSLDLIACTRTTARRIAKEEPQWVGIADAQAMLGYERRRPVDWRIKHGFLRHRDTGDGSIELMLADVLHHRAEE